MVFQGTTVKLTRNLEDRRTYHHRQLFATIFRLHLHRYDTRKTQIDLAIASGHLGSLHELFASSRVILRSTCRFDASFSLVEEGKYLAALKVLEESKESPSMIGQEIATVLIVRGGRCWSDRSHEKIVPVNAIDLSDLPEDVVALDAIETITSLASTRQIVILNEAHHVAMHRAFSLRLAKKLKSLGFQYFAAEAFNPDTDALTKRGYPIRSTGFYTHEPMFGDLVRQTLRLGYVPIAYECTEFPSTDSVTESIGTEKRFRPKISSNASSRRTPKRKS